jgi:hypothetical protein
MVETVEAIGAGSGLRGSVTSQHVGRSSGTNERVSVYRHVSLRDEARVDEEGEAAKTRHSRSESRVDFWMACVLQYLARPIRGAAIISDDAQDADQCRFGGRGA